MFMGGAAYNNGIIPFKNYIFGEAYTREGEPARIQSPLPNGQMTEEQRLRGVIAELYPLPTWHVIPPGDIFRVFERGGRNVNTQFAEVGLPNPTGSIQRLEEPGVSIVDAYAAKSDAINNPFTPTGSNVNIAG